MRMGIVYGEIHTSNIEDTERASQTLFEGLERKLFTSRNESPTHEMVIVIIIA
jgi:hypothetical protein